MDNPEIDYTFMFISPIIIFIIYTLIAPLLINLRKKLAAPLKVAFTFSKWKLILAFIGWLSVAAVISQFISYWTGGMSYFNDFQRTLWLISEYLVVILLPFTLLSYFLFQSTLIFCMIFLTFFQLPIEMDGSLNNPPDLGSALVIGAILLFEWYAVSHVIISAPKKMRAYWKTKTAGGLKLNN